jgi:hypothetical protein
MALAAEPDPFRMIFFFWREQRKKKTKKKNLGKSDMSKIKVQLTPKERSTERKLETLHINPRLQLTLSKTKRVSVVIEHLSKKWKQDADRIILYPTLSLAATESESLHLGWRHDRDDVRFDDIFSQASAAQKRSGILRLKYAILSKRLRSKRSRVVSIRSSSSSVSPANNNNNSSSNNHNNNNRIKKQQDGQQQQQQQQQQQLTVGYHHPFTSTVTGSKPLPLVVTAAGSQRRSTTYQSHKTLPSPASASASSSSSSSDDSQEFQATKRQRIMASPNLVGNTASNTLSAGGNNNNDNHNSSTLAASPAHTGGGAVSGWQRWSSPNLAKLSPLPPLGDAASQPTGFFASSANLFMTDPADSMQSPFDEVSRDAFSVSAVTNAAERDCNNFVLQSCNDATDSWSHLNLSASTDLFSSRDGPPAAAPQAQRNQLAHQAAANRSSSSPMSFSMFASRPDAAL